MGPPTREVLAQQCLPKEGEKEGNQVMMAVLWQAATAQGRHPRKSQAEEEVVVGEQEKEG